MSEFLSLLSLLIVDARLKNLRDLPFQFVNFLSISFIKKLIQQIIRTYSFNPASRDSMTLKIIFKDFQESFISCKICDNSCFRRAKVWLNEDMTFIRDEHTSQVSSDFSMFCNSLKSESHWPSCDWSLKDSISSPSSLKCNSNPGESTIPVICFVIDISPYCLLDLSNLEN